MPRWLLTCICILTACGGRKVRIEVAIPGPDSVDAPVAGLPLILLSYDRDSIIARLESQAPAPVATTRPLDSLFQAFRGPFAAYARAALRTRRLEDSLRLLHVRLDSLPRTAPDYAELYRRFAALSDTLKSATAVRDKAHASLDRVRATLSPRIDSLRGRMSRWQDSTYQGYDSIVGALNDRIGQQPIPDTTGTDGSTTVRLPNGNWWVYARSWDAEDPNAEWYWNVPVTGDRVVLDRRTGMRRARY